MSTVTSSTFVLSVNDLDASVRYYTTKLGFSADLRVEGWSFLSRGACRLRLGHCPDAQPMSSCPDHSWFAYLHVEDAVGLFAEYRAWSVERGA